MALNICRMSMPLETFSVLCASCFLLFLDDFEEDVFLLPLLEPDSEVVRPDLRFLVVSSRTSTKRFVLDTVPLLTLLLREVLATLLDFKLADEVMLLLTNRFSLPAPPVVGVDQSRSLAQSSSP